MINASFWKDKRVFLTGHTGFKGTWLSIWLHELGAEVCGYALAPHTTPSLFTLANVGNRMQSVIGDIRNLENLKKIMMEFNPDIIIHMAAQPLVRESYDNPVDTYAINVMGTVNVLESARYCASVKAIINVTTDKVYENNEWVWGYRETDRLGGYDPYSNSKACSELVTSSYTYSFFNPEKYDEHGVAISTARAGNVIGGGDWAKDRLIPDIIRAIENDEEIIIRNPSAVRPWQHVLEPLSGYLMLAEKLYAEGTKWSGAWNFGPTNQNAGTVEVLLKEFIKKWDNNIYYKVQNENHLHETNYLKLDFSKAENLLSWKPIWNMEETIMKILQWNRSYKNLEDMYEVCVGQIQHYQKRVK